GLLRGQGGLDLSEPGDGPFRGLPAGTSPNRPSTRGNDRPHPDLFPHSRLPGVRPDTGPGPVPGRRGLVADGTRPRRSGGRGAGLADDQAPVDRRAAAGRPDLGSPSAALADPEWLPEYGPGPGRSQRGCFSVLAGGLAKGAAGDAAANG